MKVSEQKHRTVGWRWRQELSTASRTTRRKWLCARPASYEPSWMMPTVLRSEVPEDVYEDEQRLKHLNSFLASTLRALVAARAGQHFRHTVAILA